VVFLGLETGTSKDSQKVLGKNFVVLEKFFCGHFIDGSKNMCYKSWFSAEASKVRDDFNFVGAVLRGYKLLLVLPTGVCVSK